MLRFAFLLVLALVQTGVNWLEKKCFLVFTTSVFYADFCFATSAFWALKSATCLCVCDVLPIIKIFDHHFCRSGLHWIGRGISSLKSKGCNGFCFLFAPFLLICYIFFVFVLSIERVRK